nr:retrovirus-related Pol polyprotein from transposon TNT 1-94 [Tanacetum cinerariifolium]
MRKQCLLDPIFSGNQQVEPLILLVLARAEGIYIGTLLLDRVEVIGMIGKMSKNVNGKNSCGKNKKAKVSVKEIKMKYQPKVPKSKKVEHHKSLATPKPRKPRFLLRWSPSGRLFDQEGKLAASSNSESQYDCSNGNLKLFINLVWKFMGTVRFENDHVAAILGFGDLQWGNILITRVYFVKGLGHNLFSVGQFCDSDLEVAFRRNASFVKNLKGVNLLKGDRSTNLYTINLYEMASASPICLMAPASYTKSWLWHQRLSHLNFDTINDLARNDLVAGLPRFKYHKEHLYPSCDINGKRYVLVIADDYSRYTWSPVIIIRTDNGTEFKNHVLKEHCDTVGISHQMSSIRMPQQNGVVERRNQTLVEAARTMLIFSRAPLFLWAEAIATACFTQNRSIIHRRFNKTPYELINGIKPDISFLYVFGALCYLKNDREDIRKLGANGDIGFFIGSGLDLTYALLTITTQQPSEGELDLLFEAMYDDYIGGQPSATARTIPPAQEPQDVDELNPNAMVDGNTFVNPFANSSTSAATSSSHQNVDPSNMHTFYQPYPHEFQWSKDHPLEQVIGEPSRPVLIRST